jgi:hypothetical protein
MSSGELLQSSLLTDSSYETELSEKHPLPFEMILMTDFGERDRNSSSVGTTESGSDSVLVSSTANPEYALIFEYRTNVGLCIPKVYQLSSWAVLWTVLWVMLSLLVPMFVLLVSDLIVLSIAKKQRSRIMLALYQITLSAQATGK